MSDIASEILAYGIAAGLSGTAFLAAVATLSTRRGVANALALLGGLAIVLAVAVAGGAIVVDFLTDGESQPVVATLTKLVLGLMLLAMAWRARPGHVDDAAVSAKVAGLTNKLQDLEPAGALRLGTGFAVLPKRIMITLLAGATIGAGGLGAAQSLALASLYVLVATALIWITIIVFMLGGERASGALGAAQVWLIDHAAPVGFTVALLFGALFTGQAFVELLT